MTQLHYGLTALTPKSKRPIGLTNITCQSITKLVWRIKEANPNYGRIRIAMIIWRNGAYIHPTTVDKILNRPKPRFGPIKSRKEQADEKNRSIPAHYPNHVWGIDLTEVYPFGLIGKLLGFTPYYILGIEDYYSRKILGLFRYNGDPTAEWVNKQLRKIFRRYGKPQYMISDHGKQFTAREFGSFIKRNGIKRRYGKVGSALSNGRIERSFKSLKYECLNYFLVPVRPRFNGGVTGTYPDPECFRGRGSSNNKLDWLLKEYLDYYNNYRPNMGINGQIPAERYRNIIRLPPDKESKRLKGNIRKISFADGVLNAYVA